MKQSLFVISLALILAVSPAFVAARSGNSMDALCQAKGFDYGIAKWQNTNGGWQLVNSISGFDTSVNGTKAASSYSSEPAAAGVLSNGASQVFPGNEGTLVKGENHNGNIQQVTFCGDFEEVPEFKDFAIIGVVGMLGVATIAFKRN